MVIKSPFKDYYDFVAHQYGGGDPKVVYVRGRIAKRGEYGESSLTVEMLNFPLCNPLSWPPSNADYSLAYLVVFGKAYLLSRPKDVWPDTVNSWKLRDPETVKDPRRYFQRGFGILRFDFEFKKEYPFLVELSRKVGSPVFVITQVQMPWGRGNYKVILAGQCPILQEIGMPALIPATQMYQELSYFMGNTIKEHPDTEPPVEVSNNCKIINAGFDLKQSFRHRVKE